MMQVFRKAVNSPSTYLGYRRLGEVEELEVELFPESLAVSGYREVGEGRAEVGDVRQGDQVKEDGEESFKPGAVWLGKVPTKQLLG